MATENKAAKRGKNTGVKVLLCLVILALLLISNLTDQSAMEKRKKRKLKRKGLNP